MMMEGLDLIPLELNRHKDDPVIISQIINMIETDSFWHHKTFESVMSDLQNMWMKRIRELENASIHCTNNAKNNAEMDGVEVINLCSVSQNKNEAHSKGKESTKQESQDITNPNAMDRMEIELRTKKSKSMTKNREVETLMMCWEDTNNFTKEKPHKELEKLEKNQCRQPTKNIDQRIQLGERR